MPLRGEDCSKDIDLFACIRPSQINDREARHQHIPQGFGCRIRHRGKACAWALAASRNLWKDAEPRHPHPEASKDRVREAAIMKLQ
jgi:hypothetical protein